MKYCLIDMSNLVFRARYAIRSKDIEDITGMAFHIAMHSMLKVYQTFKADKMIACFDASSWRKQIYPEYKAHRGDRDTPADLEIKKAIGEMLNEFHDFMQAQTNCFVFREQDIEADDFIHRWITTHPNDEHIILSTDFDYKQLVAHNVELYDGMSNTLCRLDGVYVSLEGARPKSTDIVKTFYHNDFKVKVDKDGVPETFDPGWLLFEKIIRGDKSDNISTSLPPRYPTKKLQAIFTAETPLAFQELMLTKRDDLEGEPTVESLFLRNLALVDMDQIPEHIVAKMDEVINREASKPNAARIGMNLLRFCKKMKLNSVADNAQAFGIMLAQ